MHLEQNLLHNNNDSSPFFRPKKPGFCMYCPVVFGKPRFLLYTTHTAHWVAHKTTITMSVESRFI